MSIGVVTEYASLRGDVVAVDLWYPRQEERPKAIEVGLVDVRAADDIRIEYDFSRDGWVIKQATRFCWPAGGECDPNWKEVAFVQAWALDERCCDRAHPVAIGAYDCPKHGETKAAP